MRSDRLERARWRDRPIRLSQPGSDGDRYSTLREYAKSSAETRHPDYGENRGRPRAHRVPTICFRNRGRGSPAYAALAHAGYGRATVRLLDEEYARPRYRIATRAGALSRKTRRTPRGCFYADASP